MNAVNRSWNAVKKSRRLDLARRLHVHPQVEALEDRVTPSQYTNYNGFTADAGTIIVRFQHVQPGFEGWQIQPGTQIGKQLAPFLIPELRLVHLDPGVSLQTAIAAYDANPFVVYAEANTIGSWSFTPNDPSFNQQWGLHNTGQTVGGVTGTAGADIDAVLAWDINRGTGQTVVGIIDSGTQLNHPDIIANLWVNPGEIPGNGIDDDGNGFIDDVNGYDFGDNDSDPNDIFGHGTHVAGIAGAVGNNGIGVTGVSQNVKLAILKIGAGAGQGPSLAGSIAAINYCAMMGITISNNSYSTGGFSNAQRDAIQNAGTMANHVFVVAAGNANSNIDNNPVYPASYNLPNIVRVAASTSSDTKASFSSYGPNTVQIAAPGVNILSTLMGSNYGLQSGTSMAAPMVAGALSLLRDLRPTWTAAEMINHMLTYSDVIPALNGFVNGSRRLNVHKMLVNLNEAPVAQNDGPYVVNEDQVLNVSAALGLLANDSDIEGDPLTAHLLAQAANGIAVVNADGSFTYTPNANYFGPDSFTYRAFDGFSFSNAATVSIIVNPVNDAPVAQNNFYFVQGGMPFNLGAPGVLNNDSDIDGDPLTAVWFSGPSNGTLTLNPNGSFTYTPNATFSGMDFFQYRAFDGNDFSNVATVTLQVNHAPVAVNDDYFGLTWNQPYSSNFSVLLNDQDLDGDPLVAELVANPLNGTLVFHANGTFTYTPNNFFYGVDTFTYRVSDPYFVSNTATVRLHVGSTPIAGDDHFNAIRSTLLTVPPKGVLQNDLNFDGSPMTAILVSTPLYGEVALNSDGSFTYLPVVNFVGTDSFQYRAAADGRLSNIATVFIHVQEQPNRPPIAVDDPFYTTLRDQPLSIPAPGVMGNDLDPDGDLIRAYLVTGTSHGLLGLGQDGAFVYTPNPGYVGLDSFTYRVWDGEFYSNVAMVTITIEGAINPPVANPDSYTMEQNQQLIVGPPGILQNDWDPQALPLTAILVTNVASGTLTLNDNGSFIYTPNINFTGTDTFTYRAFNGVHQSGLTTVSILVTPVILPPIAQDDDYSVVTGQNLIVSAPGVMGNDSDPQGLPLTAQLVTGPAHGLMVFNPDGSFSYTANLGFTGQDTFTYQVHNGFLASQTATVRINVQPVMGGPGQIVVVAPDAGWEPRVKVYDGQSGVEKFSFLAYEANFQGGVRVATADLNGDGVMDIITSPGPGRSPLVRVFDGVTGLPFLGNLGGFHVFSTTFTGGVFIAVGDINLDGTPDIIASADAGATPSIRSINGKTGLPFLGNVGFFNAYDTTFTGGVRVAVGDVNGDGRPDIITTPGTGGSSLVRVWDVTRVIVQGNPVLVRQFYGFDANYKGGAFISAGDINGDGRAEIILGSGGAMVNQIRIFGTSNTSLSQFTPYAPNYIGGVRVAAGDVNGDGRLDLITAPASQGLGVPSRVRFFDAITLSEMLNPPLAPFGSFGGGLFVGGFRTGR